MCDPTSPPSRSPCSQALLRKYLSLGAIDHALNPNIRYEFESAIGTNVNDVRNECWKGVFHDGLPHLYGILAAVAFIILDLVYHLQAGTSSQAAFALIICIAIFLLIFPCIWYFTAQGGLKNGWSIWRSKNGIVWYENIMQRDQDRLLREWRTIRRAGAEMREVSIVFEAYWSYIRHVGYMHERSLAPLPRRYLASLLAALARVACSRLCSLSAPPLLGWSSLPQGLYKMWYYRFYIKERYRLVLYFLTYTLWVLTADRGCAGEGCSPIFATAADFVPLLSVIGSLGHSMQGFLESCLTVAISGAQIDYLAWLLNLETEEEKAARRVGLPTGTEGLAQFRAYYTKIDSAVREFEALNEIDVRSIASIITTTEQLGTEAGVHPHLIKDATGLMNWWVRALGTNVVPASASQDDAGPSQDDLAEESSISTPSLVSMKSSSISKSRQMRARQQLASIGSLLIGDVTFSHPVTQMTIFESFNVVDLTDPQAMLAYKLQRRQHRRSIARGTAEDKPRASIVPDQNAPTHQAMMLPAGKLIGLRSLPSARVKMPELVLLQIFNGAFRPAQGSARLLSCPRGSLSLPPADFPHTFFTYLPRPIKRTSAFRAHPYVPMRNSYLSWSCERSTCVCTRRCELIGQTPMIFTGTLMENLTYNCVRGVAGAAVHPAHKAANESSKANLATAIEFEEDGQPTRETDEFIWRLCRRIGISPSLIGRKYHGNAWGHFEVNATMQQLTVIEAEDV